MTSSSLNQAHPIFLCRRPPWSVRLSQDLIRSLERIFQKLYKTGLILLLRGNSSEGYFEEESHFSAEKSTFPRESSLYRGKVNFSAEKSAFPRESSLYRPWKSCFYRGKGNFPSEKWTFPWKSDISLEKANFLWKSWIYHGKVNFTTIKPLFRGKVTFPPPNTLHMNCL